MSYYLAMKYFISPYRRILVTILEFDFPRSNRHMCLYNNQRYIIIKCQFIRFPDFINI